MTTATQPAVSRAAIEEAPALARTLARAFADDPVSVWFYPRDADRLARLQRAYERLFLRRIALPREATFTVAGHAGHAGVAMWMPPGHAHLGALEQLRLLPAMVAAFGRDLPRAMRGMGAMDAVHPHEPHWYLWLLGVDPQRQGEGLGSRLLAEALERCDRDRVPAYLQATTPRSRALYLRHGFEDHGELRLPDDGPQLWPMWREPGA
jgi:ribosomal protein S18 acetylase RimI-like enzyme